MPGGGQVVPMAELELSGLVAQPPQTTNVPSIFLSFAGISHEDTQ